MTIYYGNFDLVSNSEALNPSLFVKEQFLFIQYHMTGNSFH